MTADETIIELQRDAARVAARATMGDVRLVEAAMRMERFPSPQPTLTYHLEYEPQLEFSDGEDSFVVRIKFNLKVVEVADEHDEDVESDQSVASISFEYAALFLLQMRDGDDPVKLEELSAYAKTTGLLALYPYAREFIYNATGRLALPPLTVDVLTLPMSM